MVTETDHFILMKDSQNHMVWSKPHNFVDKGLEPTVKFFSAYNEGIKSFLK